MTEQQSIGGFQPRVEPRRRCGNDGDRPRVGCGITGAHVGTVRDSITVDRSSPITI